MTLKDAERLVATAWVRECPVVAGFAFLALSRRFPKLGMSVPLRWLQTGSNPETLETTTIALLRAGRIPEVIQVLQERGEDAVVPILSGIAVALESSASFELLESIRPMIEARRGEGLRFVIALPAAYGAWCRRKLSESEADISRVTAWIVDRFKSRKTKMEPVAIHALMNGIISAGIDRHRIGTKAVASAARSVREQEFADWVRTAYSNPNHSNNALVALAYSVSSTTVWQEAAEALLARHSNDTVLLDALKGMRVCHQRGLVNDSRALQFRQLLTKYYQGTGRSRATIKKLCQVAVTLGAVELLPHMETLIERLKARRSQVATDLLPTVVEARDALRGIGSVAKGR